MIPGYTPKQAERLKHRLEVEVAKAEDCFHRMRELLPDYTAWPYHANTLGEQLRENHAAMCKVIDRRTRR